MTKNFVSDEELIGNKIMGNKIADSHPVCGVDEAGRGPLAGPVVASAVILNPKNMPNGLNDSKKLTHNQREKLFAELMESADVSFAIVSATVIDRINIRAASLLAMERAVNGLTQTPKHALIDGNVTPDRLPCPATYVIKGDSKSKSIAAASIVAKVVRDRIMKKADAIHNAYGFASHKGYGTKLHLDALNKYGPCPMHRRSFRPVSEAA